MKRTPSGVQVSVGIMLVQCKWREGKEQGTGRRRAVARNRVGLSEWLGPARTKNPFGWHWTSLGPDAVELFRCFSARFSDFCVFAGGEEQTIIFERSRGNDLMATRSTPPAAASSPKYIVPFIIVTALFG